MRVKREEQLIQKDTPPKMRRFPAVLHMNVRTKLTSVTWRKAIAPQTLKTKSEQLLTKHKQSTPTRLSNLNWHKAKPAALAFLLIFSIIMPFLPTEFASAATANLVPNGDITTGWTPSTAGTHYTLIDEGTTANTADHVRTATGANVDLETEVVELENLANVASATSVQVYLHTHIATLLKTEDLINVSLIVNGSSVGTTVLTPSTTAAWQSVTFNGSWNQTAVDSMRVQFVRSRQGGGSGSSQTDELRVSAVYATVTYVPVVNFEQSAYRWFENQDTTATVSFAQALGGASTSGDYFRSVKQTSDGGYIAAGYTYSFGAGSADGYLAKYDASGSYEWTRVIGGTGVDELFAVRQTSDGGYIAAGDTSSYGAGGSDVLLAKYDSTGTLSWSRTIGGAATDEARSVIQASDGGYIIVGITTNYGAGLNEVLLAKYDSTGTLSWSRTIGGTSHDNAFSINNTSDNGFIIAGNTQSYGAGGTDALLAKYDSSGTLSWSRTLGDTSTDWFNSATQTSDGGYIASGYTNSFGAGGNDVLLAKYNSSGTLSWSRVWGGTNSDQGNISIQTSDGGYIIAANVSSFGAGGNDAAIIKYDSTGAHEWSRTFGGINTEYAYDVIQTSDGGYATAGYTSSFGTGDNEALLLKFSSSGTINNCSVSICQTPSPTTSSPSPTTSSPSPTTSSPSPTTSSPSPTTSSPSPTQTVVVNHTPSVGVGAALAALSTPGLAAAEGTAFRLRMNLHGSVSNADPGTAIFKLQYAARGIDNLCDTSFTNETYSDLSPTSGVIRFANNTNAADGHSIQTNANDPTHSGHSVTSQTYEELNNFGISTTIPVNNDGMWDFSLVDHSAPASTSYCFRAVYSTGSVLSSYSVIPQITTQNSSLEQSGYRWYENQDGTQSNTLVTTWGGASEDQSTALVKTSDGGYVTAGYSNSANITSALYDQTLVKYNASGVEQWSKTWGGDAGDIANAVIESSDGGFVVAGYTSSTGLTSGGSDQTLVKYNASGVEQWSKTWGTTNDDAAHDIVELPDGSLVTTGYARTAGNTTSHNRQSLVKYNASGVEQWSKTWGVLGNMGKAVTATSDSGIVVVGDEFGSEINIVKYDSSGTVVWSRGWDPSMDIWNNNINYSTAYDVVETADGSYVFSAGLEDYDDILYKHALVKVSSAGSAQWTKTWGTNSYGTQLGSRGGLFIKNDGGFAAATSLYNYVDSHMEQLLISTDENGGIANCGPPLCDSFSVPAINLSMTETNQIMSETDRVLSETDRVMTEVDRTSNSNQNYISGHTTFAKSIGGGGTGLDQGYAVIQTLDGGYAVAGQYADGTNMGMSLMKFRPNGTEEWTRTIGGLSGDYSYDVVQLSDGSFVMTGMMGSNQMALVKINSFGSKDWSKTWGTTTSTGNALVATSDNGFIVVGGTNNFNTSRDAVIVKFNSLGVEQWSKTWAGSAYDDAFDVIESSDGGFVMVGQTGSYGVTTGGTDDDMFVVKLNSSGIEQWSKTWGGAGRERAEGIIEQSDGSLIVAGYTNSMGAGNYDQVTVKFNSLGIEQWSKTWGGTNNDYSYSIAKTPDGGFVTAGELSATAKTIVKYTADGLKEWSNYWNGTGVEFANDIAVTQDGGYVMTGGTTSYTSGSTDLSLLKYDSKGMIEDCNTSTMCLTTSTQPVDQTVTEGDVVISETDQAVTEADFANALGDLTSSTIETNIVSTAPWLDVTIFPGAALSLGNSSLNNVQRNTAYRLRMLQHISGKTAAPNAYTLKLQVAPKVGACDTGFLGEVYSDVTSGSSVKYYTGNATTDGLDINAHPDDPTHSGHTNVLQSYETANNFTNTTSLSVGQDGLWDFALYVDEAVLGGSYCLRVVNSDGSPLSSYSQVPELFIPPLQTQQMRHGRFFSAGGEAQPFNWR